MIISAFEFWLIKQHNMGSWQRQSFQFFANSGLAHKILVTSSVGVLKDLLKISIIVIFTGGPQNLRVIERCRCLRSILKKRWLIIHFGSLEFWFPRFRNYNAIEVEICWLSWRVLSKKSTRYSFYIANLNYFWSSSLCR